MIPRDELLEQYNKFIEQIRTEAKDLYWLYNFFFFIESALLGGILSQKVSNDYLVFAQIVGLFLSLYWLAIIRKQRLWRNYWVSRLQLLEEDLEYEDKYKMWPKKESKNFLNNYIIGRKGLWRLLFLLPLSFCFIWTFLLLFY